MYMFVNHSTMLDELLTAGYGLKTLQATCPGGNSEDPKSSCGQELASTKLPSHLHLMELW